MSRTRVALLWRLRLPQSTPVLGWLYPLSPLMRCLESPLHTTPSPAFPLTLLSASSLLSPPPPSSPSYPVPPPLSRVPLPPSLLPPSGSSSSSFSLRLSAGAVQLARLRRQAWAVPAAAAPPATPGAIMRSSPGARSSTRRHTSSSNASSSSGSSSSSESRLPCSPPDPTLSPPDSILKFWFGPWAASPSSVAPDEAGLLSEGQVGAEEMLQNSGLWFHKDAAVDRLIQEAYGPLIPDAREGKLREWEDNPRGALALVILLDHFSRNCYRGSPLAFAGDDAALRVAKSSIDKRFDKALPAVLASFFYFPFMHSEELPVVSECVGLFTRAAEACAEGRVRDMLKGNAHFAVLHRDVVAQFGRYPHRNAVLGRASTPAEEEYLAAGKGFA